MTLGESTKMRARLLLLRTARRVWLGNCWLDASRGNLVLQHEGLSSVVYGTGVLAKRQVSFEEEAGDLLLVT
jgi:hypothetical protein